MARPLRSAAGRERLSKLLRSSPNLISVDDAASALGVSRKDATKILARWASQGWLKRLRRGLYAPIPLSAASSDQVLADPWILVPELFSPAYVGGWTAAEHWDLTEQIFRSIHVFTLKPVRHSNVTVQSIPFRLKHVPERTMFGLTTVWRENTKVRISDPHKTIVDMLDDPAVGGGIRHVASCLERYAHSKTFDSPTLLNYATRQRNGAIFKRLGFLAEELAISNRTFSKGSMRPLTKGTARLDPALPAQRLVTRWQLWVPKNW